MIVKMAVTIGEKFESKDKLPKINYASLKKIADKIRDNLTLKDKYEVLKTASYTANFSVVICTTTSRDRFSDVVQM